MSTIDVSIVLPVYTGWAHTSACLKSILEAAQSSRFKGEILIGDDCSTDVTAMAWEQHKNGRWPVYYQRNETNLGYLRNCNALLKKARGHYVCMLNNDVVVRKGWLDGLIATLEEYPDAGAVAPLMLDPEGRILECGAIFHPDGSARQLGKGMLADDPRYNYLNDVDYASAACLVVRAELFRECGWYDERYIPSYYEDADLCMKLADRGWRVLVNPRVRVTHIEGASHGKADDAPLKAHMLVNRDIFYETWKQRLHGHHYQMPGLPEGAYRCGKRRGTIAVHYPRQVTYSEDAGALRIWSLLTSLAKSGYHVAFICPVPPTYSPYLRAAQAKGIEVIAVTRADDPLILRMIDECRPIAAVFSHQESEAIFSRVYHDRNPETARIFDTVDLAFLRSARMEAVELGMDPHQLPLSAYLDHAEDELNSILRSDITLVVSEAEKQFLCREFYLDAARIRQVRTIHEPEEKGPAFGERSGFAFLGGYRHPPNVDAVTWIAEEIWPLIREKIKDATLHIYGSNPSAQVLHLHNPTLGILVHGFVADHRAALAKARVSLSPLRYGAGVKGKIGEALAVGTPVITTAIGAEGIDAAGLVLVIGGDPATIAQRAVELYQNQAEWERRSEAGKQLVKMKFSSEANMLALLTAIADVRQLRGRPTVWSTVGDLLWRTGAAAISVQALPKSDELYASQVQRLLGATDEEFLRGCYQLFFDRDIDDGGLASNMTLLRDGNGSRLQIVKSLVFSEEAKSRNVTTNWLSTMDGTVPEPPSVQGSPGTNYLKELGRLWNLPDVGFLYGLYNLLLKREADVSGFIGHLVKMQKKLPRIEVVRRLAFSEEAVGQGLATDWFPELEAQFPAPVNHKNQIKSFFGKHAGN